jgi:type IV pilus assembly protein PilE
VKRSDRGFTLIELLIAVAIVAILIRIAYPSYMKFVTRTSRQAAESQLQQLANLQEKIFLNSAAYTTNVTSTYTGFSGGGLGLTSGKTIDNNYTITLPSPSSATQFILTATPVAGTTQASDGNITIDQTGNRLWNGASW